MSTARSTSGEGTFAAEQARNRGERSRPLYAMLLSGVRLQILVQVGCAATEVEERYRRPPSPGGIQHHTVAGIRVLLAFRPADAEITVTMALEEVFEKRTRRSYVCHYRPDPSSCGNTWLLELPLAICGEIAGPSFPPWPPARDCLVPGQKFGRRDSGQFADRWLQPCLKRLSPFRPSLPGPRPPPKSTAVIPDLGEVLDCVPEQAVRGAELVAQPRWRQPR